jgi:hypothetical protein
LVVALICAAVGIWANNWRHEIIKQIRKESGEVAVKSPLDAMIQKFTGWL